MDEERKEQRKGSAAKIKSRRAVVRSILITGVICIAITAAVCYLLAKNQVSKIPVINQIVQVDDSSDETDEAEAIKALLETKPTLTALREYYTDDLVFHYDSNKYRFVPIDYSLPQNNYDAANLSILDSGEYQYVVNGEVVSHKGIDVSSHLGDIDWEAVKNDGVEFVYIRAAYRGYGSGKLVADENLMTNIEGAKSAGIPYGVYCFTQAISEEEAIEEADLVYELLEGNVPDLPVVCDVELIKEDDARGDALSAEDRTAIVKAFFDRITEHGLTPALYCGLEMGAVYIDISAFTDYDMWYANYTTDFYWPYKYKYWQYSESGSVAGIDGDVDMDLMMP